MSWWDDIGNWVGGEFNKITGNESAEERRSQNQAIQDQIQAYKDQTALSNKELQEKQNETEVAKRQVEEKQIRALRNNYGAGNAGFLRQNSATPVSESGQPTKLGL